MELLQRNRESISRVCLFFADGATDCFRDLYQDIAYALWMSWPRLRNDDAADSWVRRIAVNVAVSSYRESKQRPIFVKYEDWMYDTLAEEISNAPPDYYEILMRLDTKSRELLYYRLDGLSIEEIAKTLGITEDAVKQRLYRVRQKIESIIKSDL